MSAPGSDGRTHEYGSWKSRSIPIPQSIDISARSVAMSKMACDRSSQRSRKSIQPASLPINFISGLIDLYDRRNYSAMSPASVRPNVFPSKSLRSLDWMKRGRRDAGQFRVRSLKSQ
jgi:hypothetical protein